MDENRTNREIAEELGKTIREFKDERAARKAELKAFYRSQALELSETGWSDEAIGRLLNLSYWTIKNMLDSPVV